MQRLKNALKTGQSGSQRPELEVHESIAPTDCTFSKVALHGFPYDPTCMAFDPVQRLLAIGNKTGSVRVLGKPGIDIHLKHESDSAVTSLIFLVNEGTLISICGDDCIHMWNLQKKRPDIMNSLQFQKERLTCGHLGLGSKWLYIGTDKGNVHVVGIVDFVLSGYVVNWNKAIEISQKMHPGGVVVLNTCPCDETKLLIGFERALIVLWDIPSRTAEMRINCEQPFRDVSWHYDSTKFLVAHIDGTLTTWANKPNGTAKPTPIQTQRPHQRSSRQPASNQSSSGTTDSSASTSKTADREQRCKPIQHMEWMHAKSGDEYIFFSGGTLYSELSQSITVLRGKSTTVLEMEHRVLTFLSLCNSPYLTEAQDPYAIAVLLENDLVIVDLTSPGYPCFENPYPMDLHESPVTFCTYIADCPADLIPSLYSVGAMQKRQGFSDNNWPITGGSGTASTCSYPEIVITGHADGSVKFWDCSGLQLQVLYKMRTSRVFESPTRNADPASLDDIDIDELLSASAAFSSSTESKNLAVTRVAFCAESRLLVIANHAGAITLYRFRRKERNDEIVCLEVAVVSLEGCSSKAARMLWRQASSSDSSNTGKLTRQDSISSNSSATSDGSSKRHHGLYRARLRGSERWYYPVKVRGGPQKRSAGYQADLVCLTAWSSAACPETITALSINSAYGIMAYGTDLGVAIIDVIQSVVILTLTLADMYSSTDAFCRPPKSPMTEKHFSTDTDIALPGAGGASNATDSIPNIPSTASCATMDFSASNNTPRGAVQRCKDRFNDRAKSPDISTSSGPPGMRSRSSSASSDGGGDGDTVSFIQFIDSSIGRHDGQAAPSIWVGTQHALMAMCLQMHTDSEQRLNDPVYIAPSGFIIQHKDPIVAVGFLDSHFDFLLPPADSWRDSSKSREAFKNRSLSRAKLSPTQLGEGMDDPQIAVIASERKISIYRLGMPPDCYYKAAIEGRLVRADVVTVKGCPVVVGCTQIGRLMVHSLPTLRSLMDIQMLSPTATSCAQSLHFSHHGHGIYQFSPSEIRKITVSAEMSSQLNEMIGDSFLTGIEMPEAPKATFSIKNWFVSKEAVNLNEVFGDDSGKCPKSVAKHIPGSSGLDSVRAAQAGSQSEIGRAKMLALERGEKLSELEDKTLFLSDAGKQHAENAHNLMLRYKNKKCV